VREHWDGDWRRREPSLEEELGLGDWESPSLRAAREAARNDNRDGVAPRRSSWKWMVAASLATLAVGLVLVWVFPR
jgi:hypothetical protein